MTDDANDQASDLYRPGVFRLNIGVGRKTSSHCSENRRSSESAT
jgi:hypothetical protein